MTSDVTLSPWGLASDARALRSHTQTHPSISLPEADQRFITDADGVILECDVQRLVEWLGEDPLCIGQDLRAFLIGRRGHWARLLDGAFEHLPPRIALPWFDEAEELPALEWRALSSGGRYFITLSAQGVPGQSNRIAGICWSNLLKHFSGISYRQKPDFSFLFASNNLKVNLGLDPIELRDNGNLYWQCIHPEDQRKLSKKLETIESDPRDAITWQYRFRNPQTNRLHFLTDIRKPFYNAKGALSHYEGMLIDITRQALIENQAAAAAWQRDLSLLLSGLAHDFSNVMTGLSGLTELHAQDLPEDSELKKGLKQVTEFGRETNHLIRHILNITSAQQRHRSESLQNLQTVVGNVSSLMKILLGRRFEVRVDTGASELPVYVNVGAFDQVMLNLAANTRAAVQGPGIVWIAVRQVRDRPVGAGSPVHACAPQTPVRSEQERNWAEVSVIDNGPGVLDTNIERIFDPFFTTKGASNGSGLGLYNARIFCETHHGSIMARSREPHGLEIIMRLPLLSEAEIVAHLRNPDGAR